MIQSVLMFGGSQVGKDNCHWPIYLFEADTTQAPRLLMLMQEPNHIQHLYHHGGNLQIINNHIILLQVL